MFLKTSKREVDLFEPKKPKWKISSNFDKQSYSSYPNYKGYRKIREAIYINTLDEKIRHDIYIYAYDNVKGLSITYFICNRQLSKKFEDECKKLKLNFEKTDDYFTQVYTIESVDKIELLAFITAIDNVDPLLNVKEEIAHIVNSNFISNISEFNDFIDKLSLEVNQSNAHESRWQIQKSTPLDQNTNEKFIQILNSPTCPTFEIQFFWHKTDTDFQQELLNALKKNTKVIILDSYDPNLDINILNEMHIYSQRNKLLRKYPQFESIIKHICFKNGFYLPSQLLPTTPSSLTSLATYSLFVNRANIENYDQIKTSMPPDLLTYMNQFEDIQSLEMDANYVKNIIESGNQKMY